MFGGRRLAHLGAVHPGKTRGREWEGVELEKDEEGRPQLQRPSLAGQSQSSKPEAKTRHSAPVWVALEVYAASLLEAHGPQRGQDQLPALLALLVPTP